MEKPAKPSRKPATRWLAGSSAIVLIGLGYTYFTANNLATAAVFVFAGVTTYSLLRNPNMDDAKVRLYSGLMNTGLFLVHGFAQYLAHQPRKAVQWMVVAVAMVLSTWRSQKEAAKETDVSEQNS
jgi:hypothetical protein